jgi:hypothetical protein
MTANAVVRIDQLEFLGDIIPRTMTYKKAVARKEQLLREDDSPERNGSSEKKKRSRTSGGRKGAAENLARGGGIERYFGKAGNGIAEDEISVQDDRMDIDE